MIVHSTVYLVGEWVSEASLGQCLSCHWQPPPLWVSEWVSEANVCPVTGSLPHQFPIWQEGPCPIYTTDQTVANFTNGGRSWNIFASCIAFKTFVSRSKARVPALMLLNFHSRFPTTDIQFRFLKNLSAFPKNCNDSMLLPCTSITIVCRLSVLYIKKTAVF